MIATFRLARLDDIHAVYRFLCERISRAHRAAWADDVPYLLSRYIKAALCGVLEDTEGIAAVVMGRPVASVEDGANDRFRTDWSGKVLWVECISSRDGMRRVWREAIAFLTSRGCAFSKVAWCRMRRGATPFIFDFATLNERMA